jgi:hypothetical protein
MTTTNGGLLSPQGASLGYSGAGGAEVTANGGVGMRGMLLQTNGVDRWRVGADNTAEGGGNAGSDFHVFRFQDGGGPFATPALIITRSNGLTTLKNGLSFGTGLASGVTDFSQHISFYDGAGYGMSVTSGSLNYVVGPGGAHTFYQGGALIGSIGPTSIMGVTVQCGSTVGPTWTTGTAVPSATAPVGSLYSKTNGTVGATVYISRGAGVWNPIPGV